MCVEGMRVMQEMQSSRLVCLAVCKRCRQLQNGLLSFNPGADCKSLELATHQPTAQNRLVRLPNTRGSGTSSMLVRLSPYRSPWKVDAYCKRTMSIISYQTVLVVLSITQLYVRSNKVIRLFPVAVFPLLVLIVRYNHQHQIRLSWDMKVKMRVLKVFTTM